MTIHLISLLLLFQTIVVPYRAKDDFVVELKYNFKEKPSKDLNSLTFQERSVKERQPSGPLPYLIVKVKILNATEDEARFKLEDNTGRTVFNRKIDKTQSYDIDMGYVDDVKDGITAHTYNLYALTSKRDAINRIELHVLEDGTFLVNGEKRGKF